MKQTPDIKSLFSSSLFWDTDLNDLDMQKHKSFIIGRVLNYGTWNDWKLIRNYYSEEVIKETVISLRDLFPQSLSFISAATHTPIEEFRCYKQKQSTPQHWNF
ncbi:hypothetical protein [Bacteroides sp. 519]|uniref:DUF6922 domain-containing protein n=1 Tax=Bacteroides sp. 519 TaxID=2302937 RepID=UPI0013D7314A|nr:hypothetical protein [Bacteroides sp. 519]NDV59354.1 hypothetical protein [Bacteroides sp. 519]